MNTGTKDISAELLGSLNEICELCDILDVIIWHNDSNPDEIISLIYLSRIINDNINNFRKELDKYFINEYNKSFGNNLV